MRTLLLLLCVPTVLNACSRQEALQNIQQPKPQSKESLILPAVPKAMDVIKGDCSESVILTEIHSNPRKVRDKFGEFIELYNKGTTDVCLNGWLLTDKGDDAHIIAPAKPLILKPGQFVVLGINAERSSNGNIELNYEYSDFRLSNESDRIRLEDPCGKATVDLSYPLTDKWPRLKAGKSVELVTDPRRKGRSRWKLAKHRLGSGDRATPGFATWAKKTK